MSSKTLAQISKDMAGIDFCMLLTHTDGGAIAGRPMSNNKDVEYDGDSYFFCFENARATSDIERNDQVTLTYHGTKGLLGRKPYFINVEGKASLIRDKAEFEKHWTKDLLIWFADGVDTPGLLLIKVHATRIHFWDGEEEGEVAVAPR